MVERFPKVCLHWSCLCCNPRPQETLHSDHALASQLPAGGAEIQVLFFTSFSQTGAYLHITVTDVEVEGVNTHQSNTRSMVNSKSSQLPLGIKLVTFLL